MPDPCPMLIRTITRKSDTIFFLPTGVQSDSCASLTHLLCYKANVVPEEVCMTAILSVLQLP